MGAVIEYSKEIMFIVSIAESLSAKMRSLCEQCAQWSGRFTPDVVDFVGKCHTFMNSNLTVSERREKD